ncbi:MAG: hypothetical protein ACLQPD_30710 [Desulfomonilaceae bacterium]
MAFKILSLPHGAGEIFVREMIVAAITMKRGLEIIKPLLQGDVFQPKG